MATLKELGALAEDVYSREDNSLARGVGYSRSDPQNWAEGFAAGTYTKRDETVVAFRGTDMDDLDDLINDAMMVPVLEEGSVRRALESLTRDYDVGDDFVMGRILPRMAERVTGSTGARIAVGQFANRVPDQINMALAYFDRQDPRPSFVTGHSLGGALAQLVGQRRGVPTVAFNSPNLGTIAGAAPVTSVGILLFNARLDPLSLVTREVGNPPHGRVISVDVKGFQRPPRRRQREFNWRDLLMPLPARIGQRLRRESEHYAALTVYLGQAMLHYHGMGTLNTVLSKDNRYSRRLDPDLSNA